MASELLQQVRLLDPLSQTDQVTDVLITDGVIRAIAASITDYPADTEQRDCRGLVLGPGLVDLYSQSGEPGFEERETLLSLQQAAIAGGITRIGILPTTTPALDQPGSIGWMVNHWHQTDCTPRPALFCWGAVTQGAKGQQLTELAELAHAGIGGLSDGQPLTHLGLLRRLLEYAQPLGLPIALWANEPALSRDGVMREGPESFQFGLPGVPVMAEATAVAAVLECAAEIGTPVHLMRISTARSVELIQAAKARGVAITASTTWMHLLLNSGAIADYDPNLRLDPPLGNGIDQAALLHGVQQGVIDAIAIDHTPYTYEEKTVAFAEAPVGAIGLELALPLLWQSLVASGKWSALELWSSLSQRPADCVGQPPPSPQTDQPAELILFDPSVTWTVDRRTLHSRAANTPWWGQTIQGRVLQTWC